MKALLVRVGADQSDGGGSWNGPVDSRSGEFAYVAIPEESSCHPGLYKPYSALDPFLRSIGYPLPNELADKNMHLDPDFTHLTYGDQGERAKQILKLSEGDLIVFYSGLKDLHKNPQLVYALIGLYVIDAILPAMGIPRGRWDENAHTRRVLNARSTDIVVRAKRNFPGRLEKCIPIGDFRDRAYRVSPKILKAWGGLSVKD